MVEGARCARLATLLMGFATWAIALMMATPAISADISFQAVEDGTIVSRMDLDKSEVTAKVVTDPVNNEHVIEFSLAADRAFELERLTEKNTGRQLRLFVDEILLADPVILEPITGGQMWLTGRWSTQELSEIIEKLQ